VKRKNWGEKKTPTSWREVKRIAPPRGIHFGDGSHGRLSPGREKRTREEGVFREFGSFDLLKCGRKNQLTIISREFRSDNSGEERHGRGRYAGLCKGDWPQQKRKDFEAIAYSRRSLKGEGGEVRSEGSSKSRLSRSKEMCVCKRKSPSPVATKRFEMQKRRGKATGTITRTRVKPQ